MKRIKLVIASILGAFAVFMARIRVLASEWAMYGVIDDGKLDRTMERNKAFWTYLKGFTIGITIIKNIVFPIILFIIGCVVVLNKKINKNKKMVIVAVLAVLALISVWLANKFVDSDKIAETLADWYVDKTLPLE